MAGTPRSRCGVELTSNNQICSVGFSVTVVIKQMHLTHMIRQANTCKVTRCDKLTHARLPGSLPTPAGHVTTIPLLAVSGVGSAPSCTLTRIAERVITHTRAAFTHRFASLKTKPHSP